MCNLQSDQLPWVNIKKVDLSLIYWCSNCGKTKRSIERNTKKWMTKFYKYCCFCFSFLLNLLEIIPFSLNLKGLNSIN